MPDYGNGGVLVNASGQFVNAYTGETYAFDSAHNLSAQMKTYYDTEALDNARANLVFAQFGKKQALPNGHGTTVEWRKRNTFGDVSRLQEGVIPKGKKFGYSIITADIYEYGDYVAITEWLKSHAIDPVMLDATEELSSAAANTQDKLVRNKLLTGTNVIYAPKVVSGEETAVTTRSGLDKTAKMTSKLVAMVATSMANANAPRIGQDVAVAIVHPDVVHDLRQDSAWIEAHKYAAVEEIFNGEVGKLHGVRFVETTNAKVYKSKNLAGTTANLAVNGAVTASTVVKFDGGTVGDGDLTGRFVNIGSTEAVVVANSSSVLMLDRPVTAADDAVISPAGGGASDTAVYISMFLAKDAFGVIDPEAGGMEMIHKTKKEVGGPLEQFGTVGVKFATGCEILYPERVIRVESGSSLGDTAESN